MWAFALIFPRPLLVGVNHVNVNVCNQTMQCQKSQWTITSSIAPLFLMSASCKHHVSSRNNLNVPFTLFPPALSSMLTRHTVLISLRRVRSGAIQMFRGIMQGALLLLTQTSSREQYLCFFETLFNRLPAIANLFLFTLSRRQIWWDSMTTSERCSEYHRGNLQ